MLKLFKRPSSHEVAEKMLLAVDGFNTRLQSKRELSAAEKRHLMRLRAAAVLEANQVTKKGKLCQKSNQNVRGQE